MIVTLTANPSIDRAVTLAAPLQPGEVQAALSQREDAGGKGINVARVVSAAGEQELAVFPLAPGDPFSDVFQRSAVRAISVPISGSVRANLTITDQDGVTTKLNLPGATISDVEAKALIAAVVHACEDAQWLVIAGSLPGGVDASFYGEVITAVRQQWGQSAPRIAIDTSSAALSHVVRTAKPDLIKPNEDELAELVGRELSGDDLAVTVAEIARELVPNTVGAALITLGEAGAVLVNADGAWVATPPPITLVSTVGAGDSSLAGYLIADLAGLSPEACLRKAVRYGSAAASLPGTQAPRPADLPLGDVPLRRLF